MSSRGVRPTLSPSMTRWWPLPCTSSMIMPAARSASTMSSSVCSFRRALEIRFKKVTGRTLLAELRRVRLELARRLCRKQTCRCPEWPDRRLFQRELPDPGVPPRAGPNARPVPASGPGGGRGLRNVGSQGPGLRHPMQVVTDCSPISGRCPPSIRTIRLGRRFVHRHRGRSRSLAAQDELSALMPADVVTAANPPPRVHSEGRAALTILLAGPAARPFARRSETPTQVLKRNDSRCPNLQSRVSDGARLPLGQAGHASAWEEGRTTAGS